MSESRFERAAFRWCVALLAATIVALLYAVYRSSGEAGLWELGAAAASSFFLIGKFVIFWGIRDASLSIPVLALLVFLMDMVFAFALASGLASLERAPVLGGWLRRARARAIELLQRYPGFERLAFFGVVAFVLLPVAGTGAITGSFVARLLGLSRLAGIGAIALASAWTALSFALLAHFLGDKAKVLLESPVLAGGVLVALIIGGSIAYLRILKRLKA